MWLSKPDRVMTDELFRNALLRVSLGRQLF